jgi:hypothetical protein
LLYVTFDNSGYSGITPPGNIRHTETAVAGAYPLTWEPVIGFEPMACRLQDGCSAC